MRKTTVYENALRLHPDITEWPALCTVCVGHGSDSAYGTVDASEFDLEIMNRSGDNFLKERGVRAIASRDMLVPVLEAVQETDPSPRMEQTM